MRTRRNSQAGEAALAVQLPSSREALEEIIAGITDDLRKKQKQVEVGRVQNGHDFASALLTQGTEKRFLLFVRIDQAGKYQLEVFCPHRNTKDRDFRVLAYKSYGVWPTDAHYASIASGKITEAIQQDILPLMHS